MMPSGVESDAHKIGGSGHMGNLECVILRFWVQKLIVITDQNTSLEFYI